MRKKISVFLLSIYIFVTLPVQTACAFVWTLYPAAVVGAALLGVGASYYAPQAYEAGQLACNAAGKIGRSVFHGTMIANSIVGNHLFGMPATIVADIGGAIDYLSGLASNIPTLWGLISANLENPTLNYLGGPFYVATTPDEGSFYGVSGSQPSVVPFYGRTPLNNPNYIGKFTSLSYTTSTWSTGSCESHSLVTGINVAVGSSTSVGSYVKYCFAYGAGSRYYQYNGSTISYNSTNETTVDPGTFNPGKFNDDFAPSPGMTADLDNLAKRTDLPAGFMTPTSISDPGEAINNPIAQPPAITNDIVKAGVDAVKGQTLQAQADAVNDLLANDPTNPYLQTKAAELQKALEDAATEAENPVPSITSPANLVPATTTIDWSPLTALGASLPSKWPFNMVSGLSTAFAGMASDPVAPHFEWPVPILNIDLVLDFSSLDGFASTWRGFILLFFNGSIIYALYRRYS